MNPSSKGWLKQFAEHYQKNLSFKYKDNDDVEETLYQLFASSSLLFSVPLKPKVQLHPEFDNWNFKEQFKIIFAHTLFRISEIYIQKNRYVLKLEDVYTRLTDCFQTKLKLENFAEEIIKAKNDNLFVNAYNSNVWTFYYLLEFYYFLEKKELPNRIDTQTNIIKGMIVAANSNNHISKAEQRLIARYIEHAKFDKATSKSLYKLIDENTKLQLPKHSDINKVIRKSAYDLALLALMTDYKIDESELQFINKYAENLNISLKEQYQTFSRIQNLHLNYHQQLAYLHENHSVKLMKSMVQHNFKYVLKKNASMIVNEIKESQELVQLLRKSVDDELSEAEKKQVRSQISDLLKTIPSLAIFMVPGGSIILPILMKILPQELLYPSSFLNKK